MNGFWAIYLREMCFLRRRLLKVAAGAAVNPLLYMLTFGVAFEGRLDIEGHRYIEFLLPGLAAMTSMTQAFAIGTEISISRFYSWVFEEYLSSPAGRPAYVLGEACAGLTRVALAVGVIIALGAAFGVRVCLGGWFWAGIALNGFAFGCLAVGLAMLVRSHADQALLTSFVITPMAFLGGTFFPVSQLPQWARTALGALPLTHASGIIRAAAFGQTPDMQSLAALGGFCVVLFVFAMYTVGRARE